MGFSHVCGGFFAHRMIPSTRRNWTRLATRRTLLEQVEPGSARREIDQDDSFGAPHLGTLLCGLLCVALSETGRCSKNFPKRYRLGIVSNFYGNLEFLCEEIGYRKFFDTVIDSARVGVSKPQPAIFQAAVEKLGCLPEQVIFVGDNPVRDMAPAKALAMPHVWLNTLHPERQACCEDDQVIRSLLELREILP